MAIPTLSIVSGHVAVAIILQHITGSMLASIGSIAIFPLLSSYFSKFTNNKVGVEFLKEWQEAPMSFHFAVILFLASTLWFIYFRKENKVPSNENLLA